LSIVRSVPYRKYI